MFRIRKLLQFALAGCVVFPLLAGATGQNPTAQAQPRPKHPVAGPEVTSVSVRPVKTRLGQPCPANLTFWGEIYTNGATTVKYQFVGSGAKTWPERTVKFTAAGPQSVSGSWKLGAPGKKVSQTVELQILSPNKLTSNKITLELNCGK